MNPIQILRMRKTGINAVDTYLSNVALLAGFNGINGSTTFVDESPSPKSLVANGNAQIDTTQFKFGSSSLLLDGTGDFVSSINSAGIWDLTSNQFTIESFIRRSSAAVDWCIVAQWGSITADASWAFYVSLNNLYFRYYDNTSTIRDVGPFAFTPTVGVWYHVAVDRDATGKIRVYVNGAMVANFAAGSQVIKTSSNALRIGSVQGFSFDFPGSQDEVRITKGVARYASDSGYIVPTAAFPRS